MTDKQRILIGKFLDEHSHYTDISSVCESHRRETYTDYDTYCIDLVKSIEAITDEEQQFRREQQAIHGFFSLTDYLL